MDSFGMVAISPTGNSFYYSGASGNIVKYNAYTGATTATLTGLGGWDTASVFSLDGKKLYIDGYWEDTSVSGCTPGWDCPGYAKVTVIDTATNNTIQTIQTTADGWGTGIAVSKDGTKIYLNSDTMFTIDTSTGNTISSVYDGGGGLIDMVGFSLNSTGTKAYTLSGIVDLSTNIFTAYTRPSSVNSYYAEHMTLSNDGTKVYVVYNDGWGVANNTKIVIYNTLTGLDMGYISPGFVDPHISLSPDGSKLFVFDSRSNALKVFDTTDYSSVTQYTMATKYNFYSLESNIAPNLITGTLEIASAAQMLEKGFDNYVNFAGGTLKATGSFTLSNPVYLHDAFNITWDDSSTFTTVAGGTVDTNGYDVTFSGEVSGVGSLTKTGNGVLTLSANNTYTGNTNVNGGTLAVNADTSSSNFVVNNSGILSGNGTVGNTTVKNGGVIYPTGTSTLNVDGNLTFENGSIYRLNANRLAQSGKIAVSGTATLDGNVEVKADNNGTWNTSTNYEILSANSISGTFDGVSSDLAVLTPTLQYTQTGKVNLTLARNDVTNEEVITQPTTPTPTTPTKELSSYDKELLPVAKALDKADEQNVSLMQDLFTVIEGMNTTQAKDDLSTLNQTNKFII